MSSYMARMFDMTGRVVGRLEFDAPSDFEAEGAIDELDDDRDVELWCGTRWVRTWPSVGGASRTSCEQQQGLPTEVRAEREPS